MGRVIIELESFRCDKDAFARVTPEILDVKNRAVAATRLGVKLDAAIHL